MRPPFPLCALCLALLACCDDGLKQLERLAVAQWLQADLADRQVPSQVGQLRGKLCGELQSFPAHRAKAQHPAALPFPVAGQVAQQVEGGLIYPVQVIEQQHQRREACQGLEQTRHRFKQPHLGGELIPGGGRQVRIAHAQLRQQAGELG